ncbi:Alpha/beta hydrolase fold-1 [Penicillium verhagenii]|nr:Alpha/beta hydrolase fold-1 [Penicillium verhagenii]
MDEKFVDANLARKRQTRARRLKSWSLLGDHGGTADITFPVSPATEMTSCGNHAEISMAVHSSAVPSKYRWTNSTPQTRETKSSPYRLFECVAKRGSPNLLLNPGGPGGSGFDFLRRRGDVIKALVGDGFHLVSFDPRGVNRSTPTSSCYPDAKTRQDLSYVRASDAVRDGAEVYAWSQNFAKACPDTMGEYGEYINTPQTAADMNSILEALGQDDMFYWGFSYGTVLGQTYATLFPERSKRVIIDGVANQFDWYHAHFDHESLTDTDSVLDGFFDECIKAGARNCTLASLATSKEELSNTVVSYLEALRNKPISVYINNTAYGSLDYDKILYNGIFLALYKPATWFTLADNLYKLIQGNATDAFLAYGSESSDLDESNKFVTLNDGISGPDHWPQGSQPLLEKIGPWLNQSRFSGGTLPGYYLKQHWSVPRTHSYIPGKGVKTVHPLLILSTTYDPVCPLISARSANEAFVGSQIVEIKGYGHCSVAVTSVCAAKHVRAFLYEGKLPETYKQCEVDSPYFIRPDDGDQVTAQIHFEDPEDQEIHLAQLALARDPEFPGPFKR